MYGKLAILAHLLSLRISLDTLISELCVVFNDFGCSHFILGETLRKIDRN